MTDTLIETLARVPQVNSEYRPYAFSPDGTQIAVQWHRDGDWQVYLMGADGSEPRRVAEIDDPCWCPQFSPDGRHLYFARDDRGSECFDFYRYDLDSGALENLLPDTPEFAPGPDVDLSPDGTRLALSANHGNSYKAAVMPARAEPGAQHVTYISEHYYNDRSPVWSPDSRRLAFTADTHGQDYATFVIEVESGAQTIVGGDETFLAGNPAWSPDGRTLAFAGGPFDNPAIGLYDVAGGAISWVWQCEFDCHHPVWSPDGRALAFLSDEDAETSLWWLDLASHDLRCLDVGRGNHYAPGFTPDGAAVMVVFSGPGQPCDLFRIAVADGKATQLTKSLPSDLDEAAFYGGRHVYFTSLDHLAPVPGLLVRPEKPNGAAVVIVHGGPTWHHSNEWDPLRQAFLHAGLTVLHPNYRGSDGYGRRWQLANRFLMGVGEVQDCAATHAFLVAEGCDPKRIAVTGRSWGGFMTMALLTQFPDLFACGVAGVPFFDFIDSQTDQDVREDLRWWDHENSGDLVKDHARLTYYSPINHLDDLTAPVMLLGAELDPRCPPRQIAEVAEKLRAMGKVCETKVYEAEGHEISGLEHRLDYDRRTVDFILKHVGGE